MQRIQAQKHISQELNLLPDWLKVLLSTAVRVMSDYGRHRSRFRVLCVAKKQILGCLRVITEKEGNV